MPAGSYGVEKRMKNYEACLLSVVSKLKIKADTAQGSEYETEYNQVASYLERRPSRTYSPRVLSTLR